MDLKYSHFKHEPDPLLGWILPKNSKQVLWNTIVSTDENGFRLNGLTPSKKENKVIIENLKKYIPKENAEQVSNL